MKLLRLLPSSPLLPTPLPGVPAAASPRPLRQRSLPWPLPALLVWSLAWAASLGSSAAGLASPWPWWLGLAVGVLAASRTRSTARRLWLAGGFPLSAAVLGFALPAWGWIAAGLLLWLAYPMTAWRDAPFFPTPSRSLQPLPEVLRLTPGARALDAGCGLGHGLLALRAAYPSLRIDGVERSVLLALACRWRCGFAQVRRGDMWAASWRGYQLVYLFQRPESMARAMTKAREEMAPGSWLVSLEFDVPGATPHARLQADGGKPLWVYRIGGALRGSITARASR